MKLLASFFLILSINVSNAAASEQLYFNHLSVNNGLSQGVNNCIYRDSKGFVWISSYDGLNRFDGVTCVNFRSSIYESSGLKGTFFLNILEDRNSNLWIGSDAGLNFYNRSLDKFQNFRIEGPATDNKLYTPFYIDDKGNVWFEVDSRIAIFKTDSKTFKIVDRVGWKKKVALKPFPSQLYQPLRKIFAGSGVPSEIWYGEVENEKLEWHQKRFEIPSIHINSLLPTSVDDFWVGADDGIYRFHNEKLLLYINKIGINEIGKISALHLDKSGTLWAGTIRSGLFSVDTTSGKANYQYENSEYNSYSIAGNQVQYIYTDEKGDLWVSLWGKGVDYTSINKFRFNHNLKTEQTDSVGSDNFIRSIINVNNEFWCSTQSSGILILDENKKIKQQLRKGLPLFIEQLLVDSCNNVWVASYEGLYLIDPATKKITKLAINKSGFSSSSNEFNYICCIKNGLMLGSTNDGLFFIRKVKTGYQILRAGGIRNEGEIFLTSFVDKMKHVYVSRSFKGFSVYMLNEDSLKLLKHVPLEASIKCFSEQTDTILWIGSTSGLLRFNKYTQQIERFFTTKDGLSNQFIYGIADDGRYLWLSTNAGVNRLDTISKTVKTFSLSDGLQSNEFNTYSFLKAKNGEVFFGGVNGMNSFFPGQFKSNSYPPQLILTDIQINHSGYKQLNPSEIKELDLDYQHNTLGFEFAVIHYANAQANTLSYKLEDYDKTWVTVPGKTAIRYANLPPGRYTLKVKAFNADGIEGESIYSLPLLVRAPWWKTLWFRILMILSFTSVVIFVVKTYTERRLAKQKTELEKDRAVEKERNRISRDMHDDLGSGLTAIAILSEVVKKQLAEPEKAREPLEKIAFTARYLVDNLQDIIWVLNPHNDTLESLSSYIREYGLRYFEHLSVQLLFNYPLQFSALRLGEEKRRNIFLTVKESFNNIAKYAWCNKVTVTIHETDGEVFLSIEDDGKGFDQKSVRLFANGLKNMQHRIEQVGGKFSISSMPLSGTIMKISIQG